MADEVQDVTGFSRLDYCNSVLFGLPAPTLVSLQHVEHVAAWLVVRLDYQAHIKFSLQRLRWFPVKTQSLKSPR